MRPRNHAASMSARRNWLRFLMLLAIVASGNSVRETRAIAFGGSGTARTAQSNSSSDTVTCVLQMYCLPPTLPLPVVSVTVGDSKPMLFLVDTGSNAPMTIAHWAAEELRLDRLPGATRTDKIIDGKTYDDYGFDPTLLCVVAAAPGSSNLGINVVNIDCARDDSELIDRDFRTPHLAGILGINFWSKFTTRFDFARQTLTVFVDHPDPGSSAAPVVRSESVAADNSAVALEIRPWPGFAPIPQVRLSSPRPDGDFGFTNDGSPTIPLPSDQWLVIDTGSDSTDLPQSLRPPDPAHERPGSAVRSMVHQHNQSVSVEAGPLASLTLDGQMTEPNVDINWFRGPLTPNLGMNFLRRFVMTIDTQHSKLYLERSSNYADASLKPGFLGLGLREDSQGNHVVSRVFDEALRQSGVTPGDAIEEIDGYDLRLYSHYQVSALVNGFAGAASCLMVRHQGSTVANAVWVVRPATHTPRSPDHREAAPTIRMASYNSCLVTYADGRSAQIPFHVNPDTLPSGSPPAGAFFQRVQAANGTFEWLSAPNK